MLVAPALHSTAPVAMVRAMTEPTPEALAHAQRKLASPLKSEREEAESVLIAARARAVPYLIAALVDVGAGNGAAAVGGVSPVPRAALLVGALKARDALPALYSLIDGDAVGTDERPFSARALAEILEGQDAFDDRARAALEKLAADRDRYTRAFAAQAFGSLGDLRSKARVQALAQDSDAWVREKAATVLARLAETEALASSSSSSSPPSPPSRSGLGEFAALVDAAEAEGGALKPCLDDLGDIRRAVRDNAVAELVRAGKGAIPFLLDKLNQPHTRARIGAATALGRLQSTEAAGPLLIAATAPASTSDEVELRAVALRALAGCLTGMEEGLAASILPLARDRDRFVRAAALLCLGRLADRAGLRAIVTAVVEDDPFVVESAAVALSEGVREGDVEIVKPLLLALARIPRPKAAVTEAILIALSRVSIEDAALRVRVRHRVKRDVNGQTASTRKAAIVLLERLYVTNMPPPAPSLGDEDVPPLPLIDDVIARLSDDHPEVRVVAAAFLRAHMPAGLTGAVTKLAATFARGELTVSLLVLEALRRHDTLEAKAAVEVARAQHEVLAARAAALLEGWEPVATSWTFVAKAIPAEPGSGRVEGVRAPGRVTGDGQARVGRGTPSDPRGTIVEARFTERDDKGSP